MIGAFLHLGIRVVGMLRSSVPMRPRLDLHLPALREFVRLMIPKMLSHPIEPLTFLFFTNVATTLAAGSVSSVSFARNFQSVPVALVGVSISLAAFPPLSAAWAAGDRKGFRRQVRQSAITISVAHGRGRGRPRAGRLGPDRGRCSAAARSTRRTSGSRRRCWRHSPSPCRSMRWGT